MIIIENTSLRNFNTFGVDVKAKYFVEIKSESELNELIKSREFTEHNKFYLGGGSNVLFTKDFDGIVIKIGVPGISVDENFKSAVVTAGAGVEWDQLVQFCVERNFGGIENLSLIPGTVGAAPIQNIGAYGQELKDTFVELEGLDIISGTTRRFNAEQCEFAYRSSIFKEELKNKFIITSVKLKLQKHSKVNSSYIDLQKKLEDKKIKNPGIKDIRELVIEIRKNKLPNPKVLKNAGSFFKNPVISSKHFLELHSQFPDIPFYRINNENVKIPAAWLIEKLGWKGKRLGNVGTHIKQPLVIINYGNATGSEILNFADKIRAVIKEKFNIQLEDEIIVVNS